MTALHRFFRFVVQDGDCWRWTGGTDGRKGYGRFTDERSRTVSALAGLQIDHLCGNTWCVNAYEHMDPVPCLVNVARAERHHGNKTHCPAGHAFDGAQMVAGRGERRLCRTCQAAHNRAYRVRQRQSVGAA